MATVTAFTAARTQAIEDAAIASATVDGSGDLILTRNDAATLNAGSVIGPQGDKGDTGPQGSVLPTGTFIMGGWETDPLGYLILEGSLVVGGAITYPDLALAFPSWVTGNDIQLPNADNKTFVGNNGGLEGWEGGSMTHELNTDQLPAHAHSLQAHTHGPGSFSTDIDHDHPNTTSSSNGSHQHDLLVRENMNAGGDLGEPMISNSTGTGDTRAVKAAGSHTHTVNIPNYNVANRSLVGTSGAPSATDSGVAGTGATIDHTPAHIKVRVAVKY